MRRHSTKKQAIYAMARFAAAEAGETVRDRIRKKKGASDFSFSAADYEDEHHAQLAALERVKSELSQVGHLHHIDRGSLPNYSFAPDDLVVALGQDGLVANTAKYLRTQLLFGVNPDPSRWNGVLLPFQVSEAGEAVAQAATKGAEFPRRMVTLAEATLSDGQKLRAVNDLFLGCRTHASARYRIWHRENEENHSSSGVVVSTGLGSTGWLTSYYEQIARAAKQKLKPVSFEAEANYLRFFVREPFPSRQTQTNIVLGEVRSNQPLMIRSQMPEDGVIFSDGLEKDFIQFTAGITATITPAADQVQLALKA